MSSALSPSPSAQSATPGVPHAGPVSTAGVPDQRFSFVARQPILDRDGRVVAHDLLFRESRGDTCARFDVPLAATARVLIATFAELGPESLIGQLPGFVNADPELEIALHLGALPITSVVFDVPPDVEVNDALIERIERIREAGFDLCLDDYDYKDARESLLPYARYAKVDFSRHGSARLRKIARALDEARVTRIAIRIEDEKGQRIFEQQDWALAQGYHFARPEQIARNKPSVRRGRLLEILGQIDRSTPVEEIAKQLKRVPHLTMNVLSMADLVRTDRGHRIESVQQAVVMLGAERLLRWLHLLLFASDEPNGCADPLCQLASTRGTLMERLAQEIEDPDAEPERASLVGLLSLTASLLGLTPTEVCRKLSLSYSIEKALLRREGVLGALLRLVEAREAGDLVAVDGFLAGLDLSWDDLQQAELDAIRWNDGLSGLKTQGDRPVRIG